MNHLAKEHQPVLRALIEQGWFIPNKTIGVVISEKLKTGRATVIGNDGPFEIYWNESEKIWTDKKPDESKMIIPAIIEKHYLSAI